MSNQTRERPILFNTEMVRAILDGEKTVTRRPIKPQYAEQTGGIKIPLDDFAKDCDIADFSPYSIGDRLWVRETWYKFASCEGCMCDEEPEDQSGCYFYKAEHELYEGERWRPSIHMPREAARLFLRVTDVRAERLQNITVDDVRKEGVKFKVPVPVGDKDYVFCSEMEAFGAFGHLWDSTVEKSELNRYGWAANPWVWVIEYEREEQP